MVEQLSPVFDCGIGAVGETRLASVLGNGTSAGTKPINNFIRTLQPPGCQLPWPMY